MNAKIGIGAYTDCVSENPFISNEGEHTSFVANNILVEQILFYSFKNVVNGMLVDDKGNLCVDDSVLDYWSSYGMLKGQRSVFEEAIQKGMQFNYENLYAVIEKFTEDGKPYEIDDKFKNTFEALRQICEVKLIESTLLSMYDKEIQREGECGEVAILQGITASTDFIYSMYQTGLPTYTDLMRNMDSIEFFKYYTEKRRFRLGAKEEEHLLSREEALTKYLNLPIELIDEILDVVEEAKAGDDFIESFTEGLSEFIGQLDELNIQHADAYKKAVTEINNESQTYQPADTKRADDYSIQ